MSDYFRLPFWKEIRLHNSERRYRIIDYIASGGSATVHLAVCIAPKEYIGRLVAMQFFRTLSRPERLQKFLEAFSFLSGCTHPAIVDVFDLDSYYQRPMIIAEYLPLTLHAIIRGKRATLVEKVSYAMQLLSALVFLESNDVVHRDIKPLNIFIKGKSCMLGDFGMMKSTQFTIGDDVVLDEIPTFDTEEDLVSSDSILEIEQSGTTITGYYWSPDKVLDYLGEEAISPKSDVYQLGLVLAHLFTGWNKQPRLPKDDDGEPILDEALEIAMGPEDIGNIPSLASAGIANLISQMLEKEPSKRKTASELIVPWIGVFEEVTRSSKVIEGRVF